MIEKDIRRLINLVEEKSEDQTPKQLNESTGATDYNPKSVGGTRKELLARYRKTNNPKDAEAARKAGATQQELKQAGKQGVAEGSNDHRALGRHHEEMADQELRKVGGKLPDSWDAVKLRNKLASHPKYAQALKHLDKSEYHFNKAAKQGVAEGYSLKKTSVEKTFIPGDPDEYYTSGGADVTTKDTDYEIINNKTGQTVGTASWTTNDYFGPGAMKITMKNGATRYLDIWEREQGNPQTAFNRFIKDPKTASKYKEQGVAEGLEDSTIQTAIIDTVERLFRKNDLSDYGALEAIRQGVKHHFSKPNATVETAIEGILNILNKRMRKSGEGTELGRFKEALRQGIAHQLKKQGVAEGNNSSSYDNMAVLKSKSNKELDKLVVFWETVLEKRPDNKIANDQLHLIKMIRAERVGKKGVAESTETKWEVTYYVEIQSHDERPGEDRDYDETVTASSKEEAIAKVKKTAKPGAYNFTARQIKQGVAEGKVNEMDSEGYTGSRDKISRSKYGSREDYSGLGREKEGTGKMIDPGDAVKDATEKLTKAFAKQKKDVAEGLDPDKRSKLDDLIDQYRNSVDPSYDPYDSDEHYDSDDIIDQIRSEFGDKIADQVEAGAEKMHFGRSDHKHGYDPLGWRKPIDRQTKAGKMFKQDSDYRKNMVKSRYKLSGKSATESVAEGSEWETRHDEFVTVGDRATPEQINKIVSALSVAAKQASSKRGFLNQIVGKQSNDDLARMAHGAETLAKNIQRNSNAKPGTDERKELGQHLVYAVSLLKRMSGEQDVAEGGMPASVIKQKERLAAMSDKEFAEKYGSKSDEELMSMARSHGYGANSKRYVEKCNKGKKSVSENKTYSKSLIRQGINKAD